MQERTEDAKGKANNKLKNKRNKVIYRINIFFADNNHLYKIVNIFVQQLWDYVYIVRTSIEDWKTTPWRKIDVENMDIECKKFAKEIRLLDKEMRRYCI